ncbi:AraC-like DNA-binding protein [Catenuloplanes nepalensis]|uniref:AraC-like DNA-binding protein n=1 Tax=Catenuloplanes nepalensis TaxID=587533 RepID=A0ABT9MX52_9ACTN|nr:AraC family transcriptional regulator [Catenuloplanes nepalensis]MDP9796016.1 AraC-like DNA-binding protein [Catenuloplanes nepalensis]
MDVVSEAIGSVRVGRAEACWVTGAGEWGMRYPGLPVSGFHVLMRGDAWLISEDDAPRALAPGDVVFTAAGAPHGLSPAPVRLESLPQAVLGGDDPRAADADVVFLCGAYWLTHGRAHPYLRSLPGVMAISPREPRDPALRALVGLLDAEVSGAAPGGEVSRPALLDLLLTQVLREWLAQHPAEGGVTDPVIAGVVRQIRDSPGEPWTVQRLSDRAGLPRREFSRRFAEVTGLAPRAYLTEARLAHGARLLRESDAPLAAIARRVGYSTEFAFGGAFRREYGISPGRFRRESAL